MAQLTGETSVFATFQVTVCLDPTGQVTVAVLGLLTTNGPAADVVVTRTSVSSVHPSPV